MTNEMTLLLAFLIGFFAGLRALTAPAIIAWAVYLGWLNLERPLSFIGSLPVVAILTLFAATEIVFDKLPQTPNRTAAPGLGARILTGGLSGMCISTNGGKSAVLGALLGATGGIVGAFAGYAIRTRLVKMLRTRDLYVALLEDLVTVVGCLLIVTHL
jgi:uncharacterized membrane protein